MRKIVLTLIITLLSNYFLASASYHDGKEAEEYFKKLVEIALDDESSVKGRMALAGSITAYYGGKKTIIKYASAGVVKYFKIVDRVVMKGGGLVIEKILIPITTAVDVLTSDTENQEDVVVVTVGSVAELFDIVSGLIYLTTGYEGGPWGIYWEESGRFKDPRVKELMDRLREATADAIRCENDPDCDGEEFEKISERVLYYFGLLMTAFNNQIKPGDLGKNILGTYQAHRRSWTIDAQRRADEERNRKLREIERIIDSGCCNLAEAARRAFQLGLKPDDIRFLLQIKPDVLSSKYVNDQRAQAEKIEEYRVFQKNFGKIWNDSRGSRTMNYKPPKLQERY